MNSGLAMHPDAHSDLPDDRQVEALLAYDQALAAGRALSSSIELDPQLRAVHDCQTLLERVWPRSTPLTQNFPGSFGRFRLERELGAAGSGSSTSRPTRS